MPRLARYEQTNLSNQENCNELISTITNLALLFVVQLLSGFYARSFPAFVRNHSAAKRGDDRNGFVPAISSPVDIFAGGVPGRS